MRLQNLKRGAERFSVTGRFLEEGREEIEAGHSVLVGSLWVAGVVALALIGAGIWLVVLGATGATKFTILGNTFESTTVGAIGIFCGMIVVIYGLRRTLATLLGLGKI
ncbi:MAG: hypothetical protein ABSD74_17695 [Rhizomicrobium sp.]|jgi:hypothetical protein